MTTAVLTPVPSQSLEASAEALQARIAELELELVLEKQASRKAYSALLAQSMDAVLEDGTPVLTLALAQDTELRDRLQNVFFPAGGHASGA